MNLESLGDNLDNSLQSHVSNDKGQGSEENGDYESPDEIIIRPNDINPNPILKHGKF